MRKKTFKFATIMFLFIFLLLNIIVYNFTSFALPSIENTTKTISEEIIIKTTISKEEELKIISDLSTKYSITDYTYQLNIFGDKYISVLFKLPNYQYSSYILDINSFKEVSYDTLISNVELFNNKINDMLKLKYPIFIYDSLINNSKRDYLFKDNEIVIYFSNYIITPTINEELYINLNYHEISTILNYKYILDEIYSNLNEFVLDPNKKTIVFSFDDGPKTSTTPNLIEILKNNHATATFFMVGNQMLSHDELILKLVSYGNDVGSHSYSHKFLARIKLKEAKEEINKTNDIYKQITGNDLLYLRPPYGSLNKNVKSIINTPIIEWSVDTKDWKYRDPEVVKDNILNSVSAGDMVLMHDIRPTTVAAVEKVLPELYVRGFQVVSISNYLKLYNKTLENGKVYHSLKGL